MKSKLKIFVYFIITFFIVLLPKEKVMGIAVQNSVRPIKEINTAMRNSDGVKKVIYLTFDDGPSIITHTVLDILKENEVKATFFLIGNQIYDYENVVKRIHNEGNGIGLHTYTHDFKHIYSNRDIFTNEMLACRNIINKITGISPNIIRFPGGSRNRLSDEYVYKLHGCGFKIYDWNMVTSDGMNPKISPDRIYRDATEGDEELPFIILLLHCDYMHKNTCKALPKIIQYYKEHGYEFRIINENTPELYFPIKR